MGKSQTERASEIQNLIRQVLFRDWDPIGVSTDPTLSDEYDAYIARVYRILVGSRSEQELINLLYRIEQEEIGMPCKSPEQLRPVARKLLALDVRL